MKKYLYPLLLAALVSCSRVSPEGSYDSVDYFYGRNLAHDEIVLGSRLENPYKTANVEKAYAALYPTKSRQPVETTNLYVRFLPACDDEFNRLEGLGLTLVDHPLDYEIARDGDWYHDPTVSEDDITWQYAVVSKDFAFPDIRYEVIDECFLSENAGSTRGLDVDWDAVERLSYEMTGNSDRYVPQTRAGTSAPAGRITVADPLFAGGKPIGVAGVMVVCNTFIKFDCAYTDQDGYYSMKKQFSSKLHYRLVFKNAKSFSIGFNFLLVPASVSTLGTADPEGVSMTITDASESKLFNRVVVNNAAYDYMTRISEDDLNLPAPPSDIRIWIFNKVSPSSAVMMHHGTVVSQSKIAALLGSWARLVTIFAPDITIGTASSESYADIYSTTVHELAHSSHFSQAGKSYWNDYILYILESFASGGKAYGDGSGKNAGNCEVGEMWAYYMEAKMYQQRYGGPVPSFGTANWFHPQIFRYLDERGVKASEIAAALESDVTTRTLLKDRLCSLYPGQKKVIEQVFNRYN